MQSESYTYVVKYRVLVRVVRVLRRLGKFGRLIFWYHGIDDFHVLNRQKKKSADPVATVPKKDVILVLPFLPE